MRIFLALCIIVQMGFVWNSGASVADELIVTGAGTVTVKTNRGHSVEDVLTEALRQVRFRQLPAGEEEDTAEDNPRAVPELRSVGLDVRIDVRGRANAIGFFQAESLQNDFGRARKFTDEGMIYFEGLARPRLINLNYTQVSDDGLMHLAKLTSLVQLSLSYTAVTDKGLAHLSKLTNLRSLSLAGDAIEGPGLVHLAEMRELSSLNLNDTQVNDAALVQLAALKNLDRLYLGSTKVSDAGLIHITGLSRLTLLSLYGTAVTDDAAVQLAKLADLKTLYVQRTKLTEAGARKLQQALPEARIYLK